MLKKADCKNCIRSKDSIFKFLTKSEMKVLDDHRQCTRYKKGEIIYKEGDMPSGLICLCSGKVKILKEGVGGRDQIIRMEREVNFIGFRALLASERYIASAVAIDDCSICFVEKNILEQLIKSNGTFALKIINLFAKELGFSNNRTLSLTQKHIRGRLAESLLVLVNTFGFGEDNKTIKVLLSREDLANLSNMTTSNAIRTLSIFAAEGVISIDGRKISILKLDELKNISSLG